MPKRRKREIPPKLPPGIEPEVIRSKETAVHKMGTAEHPWFRKGGKFKITKKYSTGADYSKMKGSSTSPKARKKKEKIKKRKSVS